MGEFGSLTPSPPSHLATAEIHAGSHRHGDHGGIHGDDIIVIADE